MNEPTKPLFNLESIYERIAWDGLDMHLAYLKSGLAACDLDMDPDYQRGHVWTTEQEGKFVFHIISGGSTPRLLMTTEGDYHKYEILDGKQRLRAMLRFMDNEIPMVLPDGREVWLSDCDPVSVRRIGFGITLPFGLMKQSRKQAMALYVRLNAGGTVHSEAEIERIKALLDEPQEGK
jgi:hypothetical protein